MNRVKTWVLIAALGGLFVAVGSIWGPNGMVLGLVLGIGFNLAMYWFSDRIAIATTRSRRVDEREYPRLHAIVAELAVEREIPNPAV